MQFNSLGSSSNFARAGKAAANEMVSAFAASRRNAPNYGKMVQEAANVRTKEKINAWRAETEVAQAGIRAATKVKKTKIDVEADKAVRKSKRFAGAVAAGGKMISQAGSFYADSKDRKKRDVYEGRDLSRYDTDIETNTNALNQIENNINPETGKTYGSDSSSPTPSSTTSNNSGDAGKASAPVVASASTGGGDASDGWARWRRVISAGEGTQGDGGYTTMFGHRKFSDMSKHPNSPMATPWGTQSEAAGKYQFMKPTWDRAQAALNLPDFSRDSQEKAGQWLAQQRGLDFNTRITDFDTFKTEITKIAPEWASMPSAAKGGKSHYGQGAISFDEAWRIYNQ